MKSSFLVNLYKNLFNANIVLGFHAPYKRESTDFAQS